MVRLVKYKEKQKKKPGRRPKLKIENILIKSRKFSLPGKKKLLDTSLEEELILIDVMESPIERPTKAQKSFYISY